MFVKLIYAKNYWILAHYYICNCSNSTNAWPSILIFPKQKKNIMVPYGMIFIRTVVKELSLFYRYYFGRCSSELAEMISFTHSCDRFTCFSNWLYDFSVQKFFSCTSRVRNSLPAECFLLTYDLNGFKCRINKHLFSLDSF